MKKIATIIIMMMLTLAMNAQVERDDTLTMNEKMAGNATLKIEDDVTPTTSQTIHNADEDWSGLETKAEKTDTMRRSCMTMPQYSIGRPYIFTMGTPYSPFGWDGFWDIHEGLNGQVGAGVMVGFGDNNPFKGASFFTDVSLLYAKKVSKHVSVALGGSLAQFKMWNKNEIAGDIYAIGNYTFDEHWSASIYGSYNHMPAGMGFFTPYCTPGMMNFNENFARIGGEVTYKFNNNCAISVGVSADVPVGDNKHLQSQHQTNQHNTRSVNGSWKYEVKH